MMKNSRRASRTGRRDVTIFILETVHYSFLVINNELVSKRRAAPSGNKADATALCNAVLLHALQPIVTPNMTMMFASSLGCFAHGQGLSSLIGRSDPVKQTLGDLWGLNPLPPFCHCFHALGWC